MIDSLIAASLSEVLATNYLKEKAASVAGSAVLVVAGGLAGYASVSLINSSTKGQKND